MVRFRLPAVVLAASLASGFAYGQATQTGQPATPANSGKTSGPYPIDPSAGATTTTPSNSGGKAVPVAAPPNAAADAKAEAEPPKRIRISGGVMVGLLVSKPMPVIPKDVCEAHINGGVVMRVLVGTDGTVKEVTVISGPKLLQQPYMDAVKQYRYRPYLLNGQPVEVESTVMIEVQRNGGPC